MTAYREPGPGPRACARCGARLEHEHTYLDAAGNALCRPCHARGVVGAGNQQINAWRLSHSPAMYAGAAALTAIILGLGLLRYC